MLGQESAPEIGKQSVRKIVSELGNHFTIVSGLARGIDTCAHMEALKIKVRPLQLSGQDLMFIIRKKIKALQDYMAKNHLVLSEYGPGEQPLKYHFP